MEQNQFFSRAMDLVPSAENRLSVGGRPAPDHIYDRYLVGLPIPVISDPPITHHQDIANELWAIANSITDRALALSKKPDPGSRTSSALEANQFGSSI